MVNNQKESPASVKSSITNKTTKCTAVEEVSSNDVKNAREGISGQPVASPVSFSMTTTSSDDSSTSFANNEARFSCEKAEAEEMISQLRSMGNHLQSIFDKQQEKMRVQQEQWAVSRIRRQIVLQAIAATRQSNGFSVNLGLNQLGLESIVQSSLVSSPAKRSNIFVPTAASASPSTTTTAPTSSENAAQLTTKLLLRILADSNNVASAPTNSPRRFL